ncbi:MAG: cell division protein ZapA [Bdellovibrionales bacterium]|jgi:cell division protein ZapA|nr:cell division protein ZapA [Bdellovibrionales bacterium]
MASSKTVYEVEIAGLPLKVKSSHDEATVRELSQFVDSKIKEALPLTKNNSFQTAALLACLNIAEELITLKGKAFQELDRVEEKAQKILSRLEDTQSPKSGLNH